MGKKILLKKVFKERWQKKRGSPKADFTGHTTDHFIDGVPVQKKQWDQRISGIIDEDTFKLLTSPTYFNSLHWQKRREILLAVCGDISDNDVISSDLLLGELPGILNGRGLDDHRKVVAAKKKEINDRLREIPARIDELNKTLTTLPTEERSAIEAKIAQLDAQIKAISDDTAMAGLRKQKAELEAKLSEARTSLQETRRKAGKEADDKADILDTDLKQMRRDLQNADIDLTACVALMERNENEMCRLRKEFKEVSGREFKGATVCPTCGQGLPEDQVTAATEKHNTAQAEKLSEINQAGKKLRAENEGKLTPTKERLEKQKAEIEKRIPEIEEKIQKNEALKEKTIEAAGPDIKGEIAKLEAEIWAIIDKIKANPPADTTILDGQIAIERAKIAQIDGAKTTETRIKDLGNEEKKLAAEYEDLERQTNLMERFIVSKVEMLEDRINSRFDLARFKLFDIQVNGGINETCVTLFNGVPYGSGLNTGAEINVGIDIIRTLSDFYKVQAPVFIDHAESVTDILNPGSQTIKLSVDENAKVLQVECR
uniref:Uncharacterized protein n=1 Tax=viral metagenome TaxID=1070528 RepID=A0A6M3K0L6_9ZZZZ